MLRTIRAFFIFGILAHLLHSHGISSINQHYSKIYTAGSAECDYYSASLRALPLVLHILIGINSTFVPFVFNLPLNEIARTQFFVRWVDCNTPFPEYVLSCVFRFSIVFFRFTSCIYFCTMNSLYDCFVLDLDSWIRSQP